MNFTLIKAERNLILKRFKGTPWWQILWKKKNLLAIKTSTTTEKIFLIQFQILLRNSTISSNIQSRKKFKM